MNEYDRNIMKWDKRFLQMARLISLWSKDPSTKCGAVAVIDRRVVGMGYNGFPFGIADDERLLDRKPKLELILHAEANLFLSTYVDLTGATIYTWPIPPCHKCAIKIIQRKIKRVVAPVPTGSVAERYHESFMKANRWYAEAGVELVLYEQFEH